jgi:hypothetical protein
MTSKNPLQERLGLRPVAVAAKHGTESHVEESWNDCGNRVSLPRVEIICDGCINEGLETSDTLNYGVGHPYHDKGDSAAVGVDGGYSEGEGGVGGFETGLCAGEVSGSEETTMVGELIPWGTLWAEVMERADRPFRDALRRTGEGTSSVSRRGRSPTPLEPAVGDEGEFCSSNEARWTGNVLACGLRGMVSDGTGDGERGECGG